MMKRKLISIAAAALLGAGSAQAVMMDTAGGAGAGLLLGGSSAVYDVVKLEWQPDNALALGALSELTGLEKDGLGIARVAGQGDHERYIRTVAQGKLGTFGTTLGTLGNEILPGVYLQGREFTFEASFYEFATGIGTGSSSFRQAPGASFFRIFADTSADANDITGSGYGDGDLILAGTLTSLTGVFQDKTRGEGAPTPLLDSSSDGTGDNQHGVLTHTGNGSNNIVVDVTSLDGNYFLGDVAQLVLSLVYRDTTNLTSPFITANPSDAVVGETPHYSSLDGGVTKTNGGDCQVTGFIPGVGPTFVGFNENGGTAGRCDFHFQSDASGSFLVPEPGTIGLLGLAFGAFGLAARRRRAS